MNALESGLKRLPEPEVPEGLTAGITARIALLDEEHRVPDAEAGRDRWALALVGVTVGLSAQAYRLAVGEATFHLTTPRLGGGMDGIVEMLPTTPAVAVLAAGLLLYLAGLFAPFHGTSQSR